MDQSSVLYFVCYNTFSLSVFLLFMRPCLRAYHYPSLHTYTYISYPHCSYVKRKPPFWKAVGALLKAQELESFKRSLHQIRIREFKELGLL